MRDSESTRTRVQRRTKPGAKGSKIAGPPAPSAARKKQLNRVAAAGKALTNLANTAKSNAPGAPGSKYAGPPAPSKPKYRAPKKDVVGKGVPQRTALRLIDPIKTSTGHYRRGQGNLVRSQASIDIGRLLGRHTSVAEKSAALTRLQKKGHLPGDLELRSIATGKPAIRTTGKKTAFGTQAAERFDPKTLTWEKGGFDRKGKFLKNTKPHNPIDVLEAPFKVAGKIAGTGVKLATGNIGGLGRSHARAQQAGFAPSLSATDFKLSKGVATAVEKGALAGGSAVIKGLSIPLEGVEYGVGKGLVRAGAIKGDTAKKIKKAKFGQVTGADLVQGLGGPKQLGIAADLALDPVMWVGAGLAPETGGGSLALTLDRIRRVAPGLLETEKAREALKIFNASAKTIKDERTVVRALQSIASKKNVAAYHREVSQGIIKSLAEGRATKGAVIDIGKKAGKKRRSFVLPGTEGVDAAELALRSAEARRVRPSIQLNLMTPAGRKIAGGPSLPVGRLPVGIRSKASIKAIQDEAANKAAVNLQHELETKLAPMRERAAELKRLKKTTQYNKLTAEIRRIEKEYELKAVDVKRLAAEDAKVGRAFTVGDYADRVNRRTIALHQGMQFATEHGRTVENLSKKAIQDAVKPLPLKGRERSLRRIQLVLSAEESAVGGARRIADAITLTPTEQRVADNLRGIYDEMARHGQEVGTLPRVLDRYAGMRIWGKEFDPATIEGQNNIVQRVLTASHTKGRSVGAVTEHAGRRELAEAIQNAADKGKTLSLEDAATMADRLFHTNPDRALSELTVRRLQRGEAIKYRDLTGSEKLAIRRAEERGFDPRGTASVPLFRTPINHETEGYVLAGDFEHYGIPHAGVESAKNTEQAKLYSLVKDRQRVRDMLENAKPGSQLHDDLTTIEARLTDDIRKTDPESAAAVQDALDVPVGRELIQNHALANEDAAVADATRTEAMRDVASDTQALGSGGERDLAAELSDAARDMRTKAEDARRMAGDAYEHGPSHIESQFGIGSARIDEIPPGNATVQLDHDGIAWLRGPDSHVDLPDPEERVRQLTASGSDLNPGPFDDPYDWTSTLPDYRENGAMFELDPRLTGGVRARQQGYLSQMNARWQAIDRTHGISASDAKASTVTIKPTGETVSAQDLVPIWHDNRISGYYLKDNEHWQFDVEDLRFNDDAPLRRGEGGLDYVDLRNGQRYIAVNRIEMLQPQQMMGAVAEDRLWPVQAVADIERHMGRFGEFDIRVFQTGMEKGWQKIMASTRFGVTTPFPAYHVRNLISDVLKSLQADTGVLFHPLVNAKLTRAAFGKGLDSTLKIPGYGKMTVEDFLLIADTFGVRTGHHVAEVQQIMKGNLSESKLRAAVSQFGPHGFMSKFGASREDVVRFQTFFQRLRRNGGDAADAAWYTIRHHFNYNDLSVNERRMMRNVFLFYTWYRKNIPLQLVELVRRPGFFAGIETTYRDLASGETPINFGPLSGPAPNQPALPDYVHDKLQAATVDWKGYAVNFGFGAPWSDLAIASGKGIGDLIAMVNPFILVGAEGGYAALTQGPGVDPLTGRVYKEYEPSPALSAAGVKPSAYNKNGEPLYHWYLAYLARQTPFAGRLSYGFGDLSPYRDQGRLSKYGLLASPLTGINVFVSPKPGSEREAAAVAQYAKRYTGEMKELTSNLSNVKRNSDAYQRLIALPKGSPEYKRAYKKLDPDTKRYVDRLNKKAQEFAEDAKRRGIDITKVKGSGSYKRKTRKRRGYTTNGLGGGLGGSLGGGSLGD